jgi:hypothetical protein
VERLTTIANYRDVPLSDSNRRFLRELAEHFAENANCSPAPNQPLSDDVVERVFAEKIAAAESLMRIGPNERVRNTAKMSKAALEGALSEIRAAIAAIPSAGGVEERLRETLEGIHRLAERYTGISGTRSLHAAMHAISQAASAALGGGQ